MTDAQWIRLDGAANARDVGGLPLLEGGSVRPGRLLRSDNLQDLSPRDVRLLVDDLRVRTVIDLRMQHEVDGEGDGPLVIEPLVDVRHLSLLRDTPTDVPAGEVQEEILPWQRPLGSTRPDPRHTYMKYLYGRPDSVLESLRLIASTQGATLVHCAAGKDRTGVIVALALSEVGVARDAIVRDYVGDSERIGLVMDRLVASPTYEWVAKMVDPLNQMPLAATMTGFLEDLDAQAGGVRGWLRANGWTEDDAAWLRRNLIG